MIRAANALVFTKPCRGSSPRLVNVAQAAASAAMSRAPILVRWQHYSNKGYIPDELIRIRLRFLQEHKMLTNMTYFEQRIVFANPVFDHKDPENRLKMKNGNAPTSHDGSVTVIHHLEQTQRGVWVVLTDNFHKKHHEALHSQEPPTADPVKRSQFNRKRARYWRYIHDVTEKPKPDEDEESLTDMVKRLRLD